MPRVEHKIKKRIKIQRSGNSEWDRVKARLDEAYEEGHRVGVEDGFNNAQANFQIRAKEMEKSLHAAHLEELHRLGVKHGNAIKNREAALSFYLKRLTLDQINAAQDEYDEWITQDNPLTPENPTTKKSLALEELANMSPEQILEWLEGDAPEVRLQDGRSIGVTMTKVKIPARAGTWTATDGSGLRTRYRPNDPPPGCVLPNSPYYIDGSGDLEIIEMQERPECAHDTEVTDDTGPEEDSPF